MKDKESLIRSISGIFVILFILAFVYSYGIISNLVFILFISSIMAMEWGEIVSKSENEKEKNRWFILGSLYMIFTVIPMLIIKIFPNGSNLLMWLFILVWSTDTFAYIVGKKMKLGKHKICSISPNKSYEGLIGGTIASLLFCYIFACIYLPEYKNILLYITPIFCCLEQASDFTESYVKRKFGVKDSGSIIPGHGGFLDRFDGFLYIGTAMIIAINLF